MPRVKKVKTATVAVAGEETEIEISEINPSVIRGKARDAGIGKFVLLINGKAIETPSDFPTLKGKEHIKVLPYDEWA